MIHDRVVFVNKYEQPRLRVFQDQERRAAPSGSNHGELVIWVVRRNILRTQQHVEGGIVVDGYSDTPKGTNISKSMVKIITYSFRVMRKQQFVL